MSKRDTPALRTIKDMLMGDEGRRLDDLRARQSDVPERFVSRDTRHATAELLSSLLNAPDAATDFAALLVKDDAERAARVEKARADAVEASCVVQKALTGQALTRLGNLETVAALPRTLGTPQYVLLNEPFLIWPSNSVDLEASEVVPSDSWAKFRVRIEDGRRFIGDVKFYYLWSNPVDKYAVIDVDGYAIFHGFGYVGTGGGLLPGDRMASASVDGRLEIYEWTQPPTQPIPQPDQFVDVATLKVTAYGWGEVGAIESRNIHRGYDLRHTTMVVRPFGVLVFAVTAFVSCATGSDSGLAEVDFASGDFRVGSPAVVVAILS
jgi:hypothetical protein